MGRAGVDVGRLEGCWPVGGLTQVDVFVFGHPLQRVLHEGASLCRRGVKESMDLGVFGVPVLTLSAIGLERGQAADEVDEVMRTFASNYRCSR